MFKIDMLKAGWGDCLWIEYGDPADPKRILIDGGITATYDLVKERILALPEDKRHFELLVVTHIDTDHIDGAIKLIGRVGELKVTFGDVWFNGREHLEIPEDKLGGLQGAFLTVLLNRRKHELNWNKAFGGKAVAVPDNGDLPVIELDENLKITLLSPTREKLRNLIKDWDKHLADYKLKSDSTVEEILAILDTRAVYRPEKLGDRLGPGKIKIKSLTDRPFKEDKEEPNGSSIAFLLEYQDPEDDREKKCLLTGDAFPTVLLEALNRIVPDREKLKLDLFKISHHGSRKNTSLELLEKVNCQNFFISSSGQKFNHPNDETIARIIFTAKKNHPHIYFNYVSDYNSHWNNEGLMKGDFPFKVSYAEENDDGISIHL